MSFSSAITEQHSTLIVSNVNLSGVICFNGIIEMSGTCKRGFPVSCIASSTLKVAITRSEMNLISLFPRPSDFKELPTAVNGENVAIELNPRAILSTDSSPSKANWPTSSIVFLIISRFVNCFNPWKALSGMAEIWFEFNCKLARYGDKFWGTEFKFAPSKLISKDRTWFLYRINTERNTIICKSIALRIPQ